MGRPKFSIVIDNYNYGRFLRQCLDSCLQQTLLPHEIIVVDDGSTDDSREILREYETHPLVRVIYQENAGQETAMQRGFDAVTGDWVLGLDSDDYYLPDCLEQLAQRVGGDVSWVYFRAQVLDDNGKYLGIRPGPSQKFLQGNLAEQWLGKQMPLSFAPQSFHCFSISFIRSISLIFNPHVQVRRGRNIDIYMWILAAFYGRAAGIDLALGVYRDHDDGNSNRRFTLERLKVTLSALDSQQDLIAKLLQEHSYPLPEHPHYSRSEYYLICRLLSLVADPAGHPHPKDRKRNLFLRMVSIVWADKGDKLDFKIFKILKLVLIVIFPSAALAIHRSRPRRYLRQAWEGLKKTST